MWLPPALGDTQALISKSIHISPTDVPFPVEGGPGQAHSVYTKDSLLIDSLTVRGSVRSVCRRPLRTLPGAELDRH